MPRTPLFASLRRSFRLAQASLVDPRPLSELLEQLAQVRLDRRAFLARSAGLGALGALGALSACAARVPPGARSRPDPVIVIGAGIAGLVCAYRLHRQGVPVQLVEAQSRTGGRMFSLRGRFPGQVAELGGELIDTGHETLCALAAELGIVLDDFDTDLGVTRECYHFGGSVRSEREVVEAFTPVAARIQRDRAAIGEGAITYRTPLGADRLDRTSLAEWLADSGVSGWFRDLIDIGYTTEFGLECGEQSALNLLTMIDTRTEPFRIYGDSDERFHVRGGNDLITSRLAERLQPVLRLSTRLEAIRRRADGLLECSVRRDGVSSTLAAPRVVVTIPFTLLRQVEIDLDLPPAKRRAIAELGYGTNAKLMVGFAERVWRNRHGANGSSLSDLPYQASWETSRLQPGSTGIVTNFTGGAHGVALGAGTESEQAGRFLSDFDRVFPGTAAAGAGMPMSRFHWPSFPLTMGSYVCYRPGQWTGLRGAEGEPVGQLYFAGEHCSRDFQGFMNGGAETGEAASAAILADLGLAPASPHAGEGGCPA